MRRAAEAQSKSGLGALILAGITVLSLGGVIFGTSTQTMSGVRSEFAWMRLPRPRKAPGCEAPGTAKRPPTLQDMRKMTIGKSMRITKRPPPHDRLRGMCCLFWSYLLAMFVLLLFFTFTPLASHTASERNDTGWREACEDFDTKVLDQWGLS